MAKKGKLVRSPSDKAYFKRYNAEGQHAKNKLATLERVVKQQPNNAQAAEALERALSKITPYTRNRRNKGNGCKGMSKALGFKDNKPSVGMTKSKLDMRRFYGGVYKFSPSLPASTPLRHGLSMEDQFVALGYTKPRRRVYRGKR